MNLFATLLWKEWRDHRAALIGYLIGLPPLIAWGLSALSATRRVDPLMPSVAALGGFAIAALTLFGDLFAGEEQRGTIKLLRRLPSGLSRVFLGKLAFLLVAALLMSGWAWLATTSAAALLFGAPFAPRVSLLDVAWIWPALALAAWIPAAAIWLSRATLALPAAALTLALCAAPIGAMAWLHPGMKPTDRELLTAIFAFIAAGPLVAGLSFVLGRRRSSRVFAPACVGLLATLLLFTPAYAWTAVRVARWLAIEPGSSSFRIDTSSDSVVSLNGRYAYVSGFHLAPGREVVGVTDHDPDRGDSPLHPLCIDLKSGAWRELGAAASRFLPPNPGGSPGLRMAAPLVGLFEAGAFGREAAGKEIQWQLIDADRAVPCDEALSNAVESGSGPDAAALLRAASYVQLPDGRRAWRQDGQLMIDPGRPLPDSRSDSTARFHLWHFAAYGFGVRVGSGEWYDLAREKRYRVADRLWVRWVRPGRWIVWDRSVNGYLDRVLLYDPDTESSAPIAALGKLDAIVDLAEDGRLLVIEKGSAAPDAERSLLLLDPESGEREPIAVTAALDLKRSWVRVAGRTPSGRNVLRIQNTESRKTWFALLDGNAGAGLHLAQSSALAAAELVGAADETSLIAIEFGRRVVRARFDGSPPTPLFPR
ncbi:MAG: hypothetical protein EXS13_11010 [Planctomycetes bacterium]|nr:hypothetical protein [Planctomycetota bacterium]